MTRRSIPARSTVPRAPRPDPAAPSPAEDCQLLQDFVRTEAPPDACIAEAGCALLRLGQRENQDLWRNAGCDTFARFTEQLLGIKDDRRADLLAIGRAFSPADLAHTQIGVSRLALVVRAPLQKREAVLLLVHSIQPTLTQLRSALATAASYPLALRLTVLHAALLGQPLPPNPRPSRAPAPSLSRAPSPSRAADFAEADAALAPDRRARGRSGARSRPVRPPPRPNLPPDPSAPVAAPPAPELPPGAWQIPAPLPRLKPTQRALPVPTLPDRPDPNPAEVLAASIIIACFHAYNETVWIDHLRLPPHEQPAELHLQHRFFRGSLRMNDAIADLEPILQRGEQEGRARLQHLLQQHGGDDLDDMLPVSTAFDEAGGDQAMAYVVYDEAPPQGLLAPLPIEQHMARVLGLYAYVERALVLWIEAVRAGHTMDADLGYQLLLALQDMGGVGASARRHFKDAALALEARAAQRAQDEELREAHRRALLQRVVILGADELSPQYVFVAVCPDGRIVAIDLNTPQVVAAVGGQGWGKSHLQALIREGCHLHLPGLNRLVAPVRTITLLANWELGRSNLQFLRGLYPNPDADEIAYLRRVFGYGLDNAAFRRIRLVCLPGMGPYYRRLLAAERERGLVIIEARLSEEELAGEALVSLLSGRSGRPTRRQEWLEETLAVLGPAGTPSRLWIEVQESELNRTDRDVLLRGLEVILTRLCCGTERIVTQLEDDSPMFLLFESDYLPQEMLLPLQIAVVKALGRPHGALDPMRWIFLDEMGKYRIKEKSAPIRHFGAISTPAVANPYHAA